MVWYSLSTNEQSLVCCPLFTFLLIANSILSKKFKYAFAAVTILRECEDIRTTIKSNNHSIPVQLLETLL